MVQRLSRNVAGSLDTCMGVWSLFDMFTVVEASQCIGDSCCGRSWVGIEGVLAGPVRRHDFLACVYVQRAVIVSKGKVVLKASGSLLDVFLYRKIFSEADLSKYNLYLPGLQHQLALPSLGSAGQCAARGAFNRSHAKQVLCV
jgi:hypothetical protein